MVFSFVWKISHHPKAEVHIHLLPAFLKPSGVFLTTSFEVRPRRWSHVHLEQPHG